MCRTGRGRKGLAPVEADLGCILEQNSIAESRGGVRFFQVFLEAVGLGHRERVRGS